MEWNHGKLEVIAGPMKSAKTLELIFRLKKLKYSNVSCQVFKPRIDKRFSEEEIVSRDGHKLTATVVSNYEPKEILEKLDNDAKVIAIDEANFFNLELVEIVKELLMQGRDVIISGLDLNFRGEPFGPMGILMSMADKVVKKHAYCDVDGCGMIANRTQRIINGKPAKYSDSLILVGDEEYEARCMKHHEVPK
jgi:thymidine kinase